MSFSGKQLANGKYEYEAKVNYWMPFNGGIGFHDANWQPYFGGDRYLEGGSHGCINMPPERAAELYEYHPVQCSDRMLLLSNMLTLRMILSDIRGMDITDIGFT